MRFSLDWSFKVNTLKGFGLSACWWSPNVPNDEIADDLVEKFYGDSGLKLNIYRYNVGGGYKDGDVRIKNPWRVCESFMNEDGSYDFTKDANAVRVMDKALATGNVDTLIFFANSPHYTQTVSGQTSGGFTEYASNLRKDKYDEFAKYFIDIAQHFLDEGYPVKYISPINEPQWKWGGDYVWQEGCHYEPEEVRDCFLAFANELERRESPLLLYGPESGDISPLTQQYYTLLESEPLIMKHLGAFAYHSYHSDFFYQGKDKFGTWAKKKVNTPRFDMSEWCELPCKHDINDFDGALMMARIIGEDLTFTGVDSWTAWVGVNQIGEHMAEDDKCYCDAFIAATNDFSHYEIAMRYYAMAHFSRFIEPGSTVLSLGYLPRMKFNIFLFENTKKQKIIVTVNEGEAKRTIELDKRYDMQMFVSSQNEKFAQSNFENCKKITVQPHTLVTVILDDLDIIEDIEEQEEGKIPENLENSENPDTLE